MVPRRPWERYRMVCIPGVTKPRAGMLEHTYIAEKALGKKLPKGANVHHVNEDSLDNRNENLVICPDISYHKLLHRRKEALEAFGDPSARKCTFCQKWELPGLNGIVVIKLSSNPKYDGRAYHRKCSCENVKRWQRKQRALGRKIG